MGLRETFIKKYGWGEYVLFALGVIVLVYQVYSYITDSLNGDLLDGVMAACAIFCIMSPMTILDFARKRVGMDTKTDK